MKISEVAEKEKKKKSDLENLSPSIKKENVKAKFWSDRSLIPDTF